MMVVIIIFAVIIQCARCEFGGVALGGFLLFACFRLKLAFFAMLFPRIEDGFEPRQHFLKRRKAAGRPLLAARALRSR